MTPRAQCFKTFLVDCSEKCLNMSKNETTFMKVWANLWFYLLAQKITYATYLDHELIVLQTALPYPINEMTLMLV